MGDAYHCARSAGADRLTATPADLLRPRVAAPPAAGAHRRPRRPTALAERQERPRRAARGPLGLPKQQQPVGLVLLEAGAVAAAAEMLALVAIHLLAKLPPYELHDPRVARREPRQQQVVRRLQRFRIGPVQQVERRGDAVGHVEVFQRLERKAAHRLAELRQLMTAAD